MPRLPARKINKRDHPGSTLQAIENERIPSAARANYKNGRHAENSETSRQPKDLVNPDAKRSHQDHQNTKQASENGNPVNFQEAFRNQKDLTLRDGTNRPTGWRYVLDYTEAGIKKEQEWSANVKKRQEDDKQCKLQQSLHGGDEGKPQGEDDQDGGAQEEDGLSLQERSFVRAIEHEKSMLGKLTQNDGTGRSNVENGKTINIDEADQFTPDNWIPRPSELIRLAGKHPINAEAPLHRIYESGFTTPSCLYYVRTHGAVPHLEWVLHQLEIECGEKKTFLSMGNLKRDFTPLNLPIVMACNNNRRKELNMIQKTKGFNWGPVAVGCAYWKGPLLRDVLSAAGVPYRMPDQDRKRYYVHMRGADTPANYNYETSIEFEYIMDPHNDVLLAYEMNDEPLPPDHGYPVRLVIPGFVGGRNVKWLEKIWISDQASDNYWHIWDNRVVPEFITTQDGDLADAFFHHPDTAAYEQALQSTITCPKQNEKIFLKGIGKENYRIEGFAYNGCGNEVKKIEISLDAGKTWLYCIRTFPEAPIRHGKKFWTWCFWHIDVPVTKLISAPAITVRAFDSQNMTQPEKPYWNVLETLNSAQYTVKPQMQTHDETPHVLFRHPVEAGNGEGGWMKESAANKVASANQKSDVPPTEFTKDEIEKHSTEEDCWIVVDGCVYDATSVLPWHPGGSAAIMPHAGKVHYQTTEEFSSIHDGYAYSKLNECILGSVTKKAQEVIDQSKQQSGKEDIPEGQALQKHAWTPVKLLTRKSISRDTSRYTFELPEGSKYLGMDTCQHIDFGFHMKDRMLIRPYTPTKPVVPHGVDNQVRDAEVLDKSGTFQLTVKTYFPDDDQPGGAFSNILHEMSIGQEMEMKGPMGDIIYNGRGHFTIRGETKPFKRISLVLGGTGLTPGYSLIARTCLDPEDETELRVIDANKTEGDILLRDDLQKCEEMSQGRLKVTHILNNPDESWDGLKGYVNKDIMEEYLFEAAEGNVMLLCGPPPMIEKAVLPVLGELGYEEGKNVFGL
ncbi:hypothetical protein EJ03DRAFT_378103 [Teratosphaeria nubilosa]|uniref:Nitrate reductase [NADPH] n=1 Tax=Teratosphaeria nubilosa TaxID=161662 RepID=A0A6G1KXF9_9PEZI|nr:hypothetical protein EJ03DRAFT_378103 [Teratosphaeria nubilosa]